MKTIINIFIILILTTLGALDNHEDINIFRIFDAHITRLRANLGGGMFPAGSKADNRITLPFPIRSDDLGYEWHNNITPIDGEGSLIPIYALQPNDTTIVSKTINNWGERYKGFGIFDQFDYFPSGRKYKAVFINNDWRDNLNIEPLISNAVEFEVIDPNEVDSQVIQLYKDTFGKIT